MIELAKVVPVTPIRQTEADGPLRDADDQPRGSGHAGHGARLKCTLLEPAPRQFVRIARQLGARRHAKRSIIHSVYFDTPGCLLRGSGHLLRTARDGEKGPQILELLRSTGSGEAQVIWERYLSRKRSVAELLSSSPLPELLSDPEAITQLRPVFSSSIERDIYHLDRDGTAVELILDDCLLFNDRTRHRIVGGEFKLRKGTIQGLTALLREIQASAPLLLSPPSHAEHGYWLLNVQPMRPATKLAFDMRSDMTPPEAFRTFGAVCTSALCHNLVLLLAGGGPDVLHQSRVCIRRIRTLLSCFKSSLRPTYRKTLQLELKWASDLLGRTRELDVLIERTLPPVIRDNCDVPGFEAFQHSLRHVRANAHAATLLSLQSARMFELCLELATCFGELGSPSQTEPLLPRFRSKKAGPFVSEQLLTWQRSLLADSASISTLGPVRLHRIRIRAKKLRYAVEAFGCFMPGDQAEQAGSLIAIQGALGRVNDGRISRELVLGYAASMLPRNAAERASLIAAGVTAATCIAGEEIALAQAQVARDQLATRLARFLDSGGERESTI